MTPVLPAISAPLAVAGTAAALGQEAPSSRRRRRRGARGVGDMITVDGVDGTEVQIRVIGIADIVDRALPAVDSGPDAGAAAAAGPGRTEPSERQEVVGLRMLDDSAIATGQVVQAIWNFYNGPDQNRHRPSSATQPGSRSRGRWPATTAARPPLALFGIIALVAAPCAMANVPRPGYLVSARTSPC